MEEFTVIYKILRALRAQMDYEERSGVLSAEQFKVSDAKFNRLIGMLLERPAKNGVSFNKIKKEKASQLFEG